MTRPALPHLPQFALRVAVSTALVLTGASLFGRELVDVLRPVFASVLGWVADDFLILGLNLVQEGPDSAVEARAILKDVILLGGRAIVPDGRTGFAVSTTVGTVLQPVLVATGLVFAWPGRPLEFPLRLALCLLLLVPVVLSDALCILRLRCGTCRCTPLNRLAHPRFCGGWASW